MGNAKSKTLKGLPSSPEDIAYEKSSLKQLLRHTRSQGRQTRTREEKDYVKNFFYLTSYIKGQVLINQESLYDLDSYSIVLEGEISFYLKDTQHSSSSSSSSQQTAFYIRKQYQEFSLISSNELPFIGRITSDTCDVLQIERATFDSLLQRELALPITKYIKNQNQCHLIQHLLTSPSLSLPPSSSHHFSGHSISHSSSSSSLTPSKLFYGVNENTVYAILSFFANLIIIPCSSSPFSNEENTPPLNSSSFPSQRGFFLLFEGVLRIDSDSLDRPYSIKAPAILNLESIFTGCDHSLSFTAEEGADEGGRGRYDNDVKLFYWDSSIISALVSLSPTFAEQWGSYRSSILSSCLRASPDIGYFLRGRHMPNFNVSKAVSSTDNSSIGSTSVAHALVKHFCIRHHKAGETFSFSFTGLFTLVLRGRISITLSGIRGSDDTQDFSFEKIPGEVFGSLLVNSDVYVRVVDTIKIY